MLDAFGLSVKKVSEIHQKSWCGRNDSALHAVISDVLCFSNPQSKMFIEWY